LERSYISIILGELIYGITFLLLSITNGIHNLFDLNCKNQTLMIGIFFIIIAPITFFFIKKSTPQVKHPQAMAYGILLLIIGLVFFIWNFYKGLAVSYFSIGYFLVGSLVLAFNALVGLILIIKSLKVKSKSHFNG